MLRRSPMDSVSKPKPKSPGVWYYDKKELRNTPSIQSGMSFEFERQCRKEGARFILDVGNELELGYNTSATGAVYFHRFYMVHSFKMFPKYLTACCALFLAGKVEETPKKCRDLIKMVEKYLPPEEYLKFGSDIREEIMVMERIMLQSIKFDLQVDHPYDYLIKYTKYFLNKGKVNFKERTENMLQMAWTFANDSLCTTMCVQWEPEIVAIAMLYLSAKLNKYDITDWSGRTTSHKYWWDLFVEGITLELLEDLCHQVLDLYSQTQKVPAQPEAQTKSSQQQRKPDVKPALPALPNQNQIPQPTLHKNFPQPESLASNASNSSQIQQHLAAATAAAAKVTKMLPPPAPPVALEVAASGLKLPEKKISPQEGSNHWEKQRPSFPPHTDKRPPQYRPYPPQQHFRPPLQRPSMNAPPTSYQQQQQQQQNYQSAPYGNPYPRHQQPYDYQDKYMEGDYRDHHYYNRGYGGSQYN